MFSKMYVYEALCPQQMLDHEGGQMNIAQLVIQLYVVVFFFQIKI